MIFWPAGSSKHTIQLCSQALGVQSPICWILGYIGLIWETKKKQQKYRIHTTQLKVVLYFIKINSKSTAEFWWLYFLEGYRKNKNLLTMSPRKSNLKIILLLCKKNMFKKVIKGEKVLRISTFSKMLQGISTLPVILS